MPELVLTTIEDRIMKIVINRPEKKNALTMSMYSAMTSAIKHAEEERSVRVIFITGSGGTFTSGNDIGEFIQNPPSDESSPVFLFLRAITEARKPIVAAVEGTAVGIGVTMLLHFDLAYASDTARFSLPFVNLGLVPEAGSSLLLPMTAGYHGAAEMLMLGEPFDSSAALKAGIITGIFSGPGFLDAAWKKALDLAQKPPEALMLTKDLLKRKYLPAIREAIMDENKLFVSKLRSPEAAEAFSAFIERRKPDFTRF